MDSNFLGAILVRPFIKKTIALLTPTVSPPLDLRTPSSDAILLQQMKSPKHRTHQAAYIAKANSSHFQKVADRNRKIQPIALVKPTKAAPLTKPEITSEPAALESTPPKE